MPRWLRWIGRAVAGLVLLVVIPRVAVAPGDLRFTSAGQHDSAKPRTARGGRHLVRRWLGTRPSDQFARRTQ